MPRKTSPGCVLNMYHQTPPIRRKLRYTRGSWSKSTGPAPGQRARTGTARWGTWGPGRCAMGFPTTYARCWHRRVRTKPVATWFWRSVRLLTATTRPATAPTTMAVAIPATRRWLARAAAKAAMALRRMSPSRERLMTPARSARVSPRTAYTTGGEALTTAAARGTMSMALTSSCRAVPAVHRGGELHHQRELQAARGDQGEEQGDGEGGRRAEVGQQDDEDPEKPVPPGDEGEELVARVRAGEEDEARETGEGPARGEGGEGDPGVGDAAEVGGAGAPPHGLELQPEGRPGQDHLDEGDPREPQEDLAGHVHGGDPHRGEPQGRREREGPAG